MELASSLQNSESAYMDANINAQADIIISSDSFCYVSNYTNQKNVFGNSGKNGFKKNSLYYKDLFLNHFFISSTLRMAFKSICFPVGHAHIKNQIVPNSHQSTELKNIQDLLQAAVETEDLDEIIAIAWNIVNRTLDDTVAQQQLGEASGMCRTMVFLLKKYENDGSVMEAILTAIAVLTRCGEDRSLTNVKVLNLLMAAQAPDMIIKVLKSHRASLEICERACLAISHLAHDKKQRLQFAAAGACELLVDVIRIHSSCLPVINRAMNAAVNLIPEESCFDTFTELGIVHIALQYVKCGNESIVAAICSIVAQSLNRMGSLDTVNSAETMAAIWVELVWVLKVWKASEKVAGLCLLAMSLLMQIFPKVAENLDPNISVIIRSVVKTFDQCRLVCIYGILCIALQCHYMGNIGSITPLSEECALLLDSLRSSSCNESIEVACIALVEVIKCNREFPAFLRGLGICDVIETLLKRLATSIDMSDPDMEAPPVIFAMCNLIVSMCQLDAAIQSDILGRGASVHIIHFLSQCSSTNLSFYLLRTAVHLCGLYNVDEHWSADGALDFSRRGVVDFATTQLETSVYECLDTGPRSVNEADIIRASCHTMCTVALAGDVPGDVRANTLNLLLKILQSSNDFGILTSAISTIACLVASSDDDSVHSFDLIVMLISFLKNAAVDVDDSVVACCSWALRNFLYCGGSAEYYVKEGVVGAVNAVIDGAVDTVYALHASLMLLCSTLESLVDAGQTWALSSTKINVLMKKLFELVELKCEDEFLVGSVVRVVGMLNNPTTSSLKYSDFTPRPVYGEILLSAAISHSEDDELCSLCLDAMNKMPSVLSSICTKNACELIADNVRRYELGDEVALSSICLLSQMPVALSSEDVSAFDIEECRAIVAIATGALESKQYGLLSCAIKAITKLARVENSCQTQLGSFGICIILVDICKDGSDGERTEAMLNALWCIKYLCARSYYAEASDRNVTAVVNRGGIEIITSLLKTHISNAKMVIACISVLRCLLATPAGKDKCRCFDFCELVFVTIELHGDDLIVIQSCDILSAIVPCEAVFSTAEKRATLLCQILKSHKEELLARSCIRFMIALLDVSDMGRVEKFQGLFFNEDLISILMGIAVKHVDDIALKCLLLTCLKVVVRNSESRTQDLLSRSICIDFALKCLSFNNTAVVMATTDLLLTIYAVQNEEYPSKTKVYHAVASTLERYIGDLTIARNCIKLLHTFVVLDPMSVDFLNRQVIHEVVMNTFRKHLGDSKLAATASDLLTLLSNEKGGIDACGTAVNTLRRLPHNNDAAEVVAALAVVHKLLTGSGDDQARFTTSATFTTLMELMGKWQQNQYVETAVFKTIWCLCSSDTSGIAFVPSAIDILIEVGGVDGVQMILFSMWEVPGVAELGVGILYFLVSHRQDLVDKMHCEQLARLSECLLQTHRDDCNVVKNTCLFISAVVVLPGCSTLYCDNAISETLSIVMNQYWDNEVCLLQIVFAISGLVYTQGLTLANHFIAHSSNVGVLLNALKFHWSSAPVVSAVCVLIVNLTILLEDEFTLVLQENEGIEALIAVIKRASQLEHKDSLGHILDVMYMLCMNDCDIRSHLSSLSGLDMFASVISGNFHNDAKILRMTALCIYAMTDVDNIDPGDANKIFLLSLRLLGENSSSEPELVLALCLMISSLVVRPDLASLLVELNPTDTLCCIFEQFIEIKDVVDQCCAALIAISNYDKCCKLVCASNVSDIIVLGMSKHLETGDTIVNMSTLLKSLITCDSSVAFKLAENGICDATKNIISSHSTDSLLIKHVCLYTAEFCKYVDLLKIWVENGVLKSVIQVPGLADVLDEEAATAWLKLLLEVASMDAGVLTAMLEYDVAPIVFSIFQKYLKSDQVVIQSCNLIDTLSNNPDICSQFGHLSCCQLITRRLSESTTSVEVTCALLKAMKGLCADPSNQYILGNVDTCKHLAEILDHSEPLMFDLELAVFTTVSALANKNVVIQGIMYDLSIHVFARAAIIRHQNATVPIVATMCIALIASGNRECMSWVVASGVAPPIATLFVALAEIDQQSLMLCTAMGIFANNSTDVVTQISSESVLKQTLALWAQSLDCWDNPLSHFMITELLKINASLITQIDVKLVDSSIFSSVCVNSLRQFELGVDNICNALRIMIRVCNECNDIGAKLCNVDILDEVVKLFSLFTDNEEALRCLCQFLICLSRCDVMAVQSMCSNTDLIAEITRCFDRCKDMPLALGDACIIAATLLASDSKLFDHDILCNCAVACMSRFVDNPVVCKHMCSAVIVLSAASCAVCDCLTAYNLCDVLIRIIRQYVSDEHMVSLCVQVFQNLTMESISSICECGDRGVGEILIDCMRMCCEMQTAVDISLTLINMCSANERNSYFVTHHNGYEVLMNMLQKYHDRSIAVVAIGGMLQILASFDENVRNQLSNPSIGEFLDGIMDGFKNNPEVLSLVLNLMAIAKETTEQNVTADVCANLVGSFKSNMSDVKLVSQVCGSLSALIIASPPCADILGDCGLCPLAVEVAMNYKNDPDVAEKAFTLLGYLAMESETNLTFFENEDVTSLVLDAFEMHENAFNALRAICVAVRYISYSEKCRNRFNEVGLSQKMLNILKRLYTNNTDIAEISCWALRKLICEETKDEFSVDMVIDCAVLALEVALFYKNDINCSKACYALMHNLLTIDEVKRSLLELDVPKNVIELAAAFPEDKWINTYVIGIISRILTLENSSNRVDDKNVYEYCVNIIRRYQHIPEIVEDGYFAILILTTFNANNVALFLGNGGIDTMIACLSTYSQNAKTVREIYGLLEFLGHFSSCVATLSKANIYTVVTSIGFFHIEDHEVADLLFSIIISFVSTNEAQSENWGESGMCQLCAELLNKHVCDDVLVEKGFSALWYLLSGCHDNSKYFCSWESVEAIVAAMGKSVEQYETTVLNSLLSVEILVAKNGEVVETFHNTNVVEVVCGIISRMGTVPSLAIPALRVVRLLCLTETQKLKFHQQGVHMCLEEMLMEHEKNKALDIACVLDTVRVLCSDCDFNKEFFSREDLFKTIVNMLEHSRNDHNLWEKVCGALCSIAKGGVYTSLPDSILRHVLTMLKSSLEDVSMCRVSCEVIFIICSGPNSRMLTRLVDPIDTVCAICKRYSESLFVEVLQATAALCSHYPNVKTLRSSDIVSILITACKIESPATELSLWLQKAIFAIIRDRDDDNKGNFIKSEDEHAMMVVFRRVFGDAAAADSVILVSAQMANALIKHDNRKVSSLGDVGVCEALVTTLKTKLYGWTDMKTCEEVSVLLASLCTDSKCRIRLVVAGLLEFVIDMMDGYPEKESVAMCFSMVVRAYTAIDSNDRDKFQTAVGLSGVLASVIKAIEFHLECTSLTIRLLQALYGIAYAHDTNCNSLASDLNIMMTMWRVLQAKCNVDMNIARECANVSAAIAKQNDACNRSISHCGLCDSLVDCLRWAVNIEDHASSEAFFNVIAIAVSNFENRLAVGSIYEFYVIVFEIFKIPTKFPSSLEILALSTLAKICTLEIGITPSETIITFLTQCDVYTQIAPVIKRHVATPSLVRMAGDILFFSLQDCTEDIIDLMGEYGVSALVIDALRENVSSFEVVERYIELFDRLTSTAGGRALMQPLGIGALSVEVCRKYQSNRKMVLTFCEIVIKYDDNHIIIPDFGKAGACELMVDIIKRNEWKDIEFQHSLVRALQSLLCPARIQHINILCEDGGEFAIMQAMDLWMEKQEAFKDVVCLGSSILAEIWRLRRPTVAISAIQKTMFGLYSLYEGNADVYISSCRLLRCLVERDSEYVQLLTDQFDLLNRVVEEMNLHYSQGGLTLFGDFGSILYHFVSEWKTDFVNLQIPMEFCVEVCQTGEDYFSDSPNHLCHLCSVLLYMSKSFGRVASRAWKAYISEFIIKQCSLNQSQPQLLVSLFRLFIGLFSEHRTEGDISSGLVVAIVDVLKTIISAYIAPRFLESSMEAMMLLSKLGVATDQLVSFEILNFISNALSEAVDSKRQDDVRLICLTVSSICRNIIDAKEKFELTRICLSLHHAMVNMKNHELILISILDAVADLCGNGDHINETNLNACIKHEVDKLLFPLLETRDIKCDMACALFRALASLTSGSGVSKHLGDVGACPLLAALFRMYALTNMEFLGPALVVVRNLVAVESNCLKLSDIETLQTLLSVLMTIGDSDILVALQSAMLLRHVIPYASKTDLNVFGQNQGCKDISKALRIHMTVNEEMSKDLCHIVWGLCNKMSSNKSLFCDCGAVESIVQIVRIYKASNIVVLAANGALRSLSYLAIACEQMFIAGYCDMMVFTLRTHMTTIETVDNILGTVANICTHKPAQLVISESSSCDVVVACCGMYSGSASVSASCCRIFTSQCYLPGNSKYLCDSGVCDLLVEMLRNHISIDGFLKYGCLTARTITSSAENIPFFLKVAGDEVICRVLTINVASPLVVDHGIQTLSNLLVSQTFRDTPSVNAGNTLSVAFKCASSALSSFPDNSDVVMSCCRLIHGVTVHGFEKVNGFERIRDIQQCLASCGIISSLCIVISNFLKTMSVLSVLVNALTAVCDGCESNCNLFAGHDAFESIINSYAALSVNLEYHYVLSLANLVITLCDKNDVNSASAIMYGGCKFFISNLIARVTEPDVVLCCCRALCCVHTSNRMDPKAIDASLAEAVCNSLQLHFDRKNVTAALCELSIHLLDDESKVLAYTQHGACEVLSRNVIFHSSTESSNLFPIIVNIRQLCSNADCIMRFCKADLCPSILRTLTERLDDVRLVIELSGAMCCLVSHEYGRNAFIQCPEIYSTLSATLKLHISNDDIVKKMCLCVTSIVHSETQRYRIGESDIFDSLALCFQLRLQGGCVPGDDVMCTLVQVVSTLGMDNPGNVVKMREMGTCEHISMLLSIFKRDCLLTRHLFFAIGVLCIDDECKNWFGSISNCSTIINVLENGIIDNGFSIIVLTAVYKVCSGMANVKEQFCKSGLCAVILEILRIQSSHIEVVSVSCAVVWSLVNGSVKNAHVLSAIMGCSEIFVETLRLHLNVPSVSGALCGIIAEILNDNNHFSSVRIRAVDEIALSLINLHQQQPSFAVHLAVRLLRVMQRYEVDTYGSDNDISKLRKIIDTAAGLFVSQQNSPKVLEELCGLLSIVLSSATGELRFGIDKYTFCEYVHMSLATAMKLKNEVLAITACSAIVNLCKNHGANQATMGKIGACSSIISLLKSMNCATDELALELETASLLAVCVLIRHKKSKESESADNSNAFVDTGACEVVVECLQKRIENPCIASLACRAISYLAGNEQSSGRLTRCGACEIIVVAHNKHGNLVEVAEYASSAVANLALHDDANSLLVAAGATQALVETLSSCGTSSSDVAKMTCIAIDNLIGDRDNLRAKMGDNNACSIMLNVLKNFESNGHVISAACKAMANLISDNKANSLAVFKLDGCSVIMECAGNHKQDPDVCYSALLFCISMCSNVSESAISFLEHGVCSMLASALEDHSRITNLIRLTCVVINTLCQLETNTASVMGAFSVPEKLVMALQNHVQDAAVTIIGIKVMVDLMENCPENMLRLNSIHSTRLIFRALSLDPIPRAVAVNSCNAICLLSSDVGTRILLKQANVCPRICSLLKLFVVDQDMVIRICSCIHVLSKDCMEVKIALCESGISEPIVASYKLHCMNKDAGKQICSAILDLVEENRSALIEYSGETMCQSISSFMIKFNMDEECVEVSCNLIKLLARSGDNRKILGGCGVCNAITAPLIQFMNKKKCCFEVLSALHALTVDNKDNVEILGFKGACEGVCQALSMYKQDVAVVSLCFKIVACLGVNSSNSLRFGKAGTCAVIVELLSTHIMELVLLRLACVSIGVLCADMEGNRAIFTQCGICNSFVALMEKYSGDEPAMELVCGAMLHILNGENTAAIAAVLQANMIHSLANILQANLGISRVINCACQVILLIAKSKDAGGIDFIESGVCEKLVLCLSCHLSDKNANVHICACIRAVAGASLANKYKFGQLGTCDVLWKALQFAVDFEDIKLTQAALMSISELVQDCCANQEYFARTEICDVISEVVGAENGVIVDENALWCIAYLCRCSEDLITIHEQNCLKFGENGVIGSIVIAIQEHQANDAVVVAGLTALRNICGFSKNIGRIGVFGCCQLTCALLQEYMHNSKVCTIGCDAISSFAFGKNVQDFLDCDIGELLTLVLRRHMDKPLIIGSVCDCVKRIVPNARDECIVDRGMCGILTECCRQYNENSHVVEKVCQAITTLSDVNIRYKREFGALGVCEAIVHVLKTHAPNSSAISSAVEALNSLKTGSHENEERIRIVGGLALLATSSRSLGLWSTALNQVE